MNEVDSGSLTPPLSPFGLLLEEVPSPVREEQIDVDDSIPASCFTCCGEVSSRGDNFHTSGFWKSNFLSRLVKGEVERCEAPGSTELPSLFGYHWSQNTVLNNDLDQLFLILRQHVGEIQMLAVKSRLTFDTEVPLPAVRERREQVNSFLQFIMEYLIRTPGLSDGCLETLVRHLHTLLLHLDRIPELPPHVMQDPAEGANTRGSACHISFHLCLDIYWRLLSIFHVLQVKYPGFRYSGCLCSMPDEDSSHCLYDQMLHLVVWDLTSLAQLRYLTKVVSHEYTKTCMFSCTCVRELWILLLKLSEYRAANNMGETFWIQLHHVLKSVCDMERDNNTCPMEVDDSRVLITPPESLRVDEPVSLTLWTLYSVAPLYRERSQINYKGEGTLVDNYHDLQTILKKLLASPSVTESELRRHLKACLRITSQWEPNMNILIILWDHFYKKLNQNDMFQTSGSIMDGLACIDQSVATMFDRCQNWTQTPLEKMEKDTSYQLFLRVLVLHLGRLYSTGYTQEWKQIKGRIYSKFHPRRVRELMEGGLYNLTCLFVTLALITDLEDVASKLCDFYNMLDMGSVTFACRSMVWRGAFTLMLVYEQRHVDISFLADKMVSAFTGCVSDFKTAGIDTRHQLWKLIVTYLEGTQEVVDTSHDLQTSEHKLLCEGIKSLMTVCAENELRSLLTTMQTIIDKFRQVTISVERQTVAPVRHSLQHTEFAGQLWRNVYPFICDHAQTLTPPSQVADIAASFCMLVISFPPLECTGSNDTFLSVFKYFASGEKVNISVSCRFLSHMLSCQEVVEKLQRQQEQYETFIVRAWIRCFLQVPSGSQQLAEVTRLVLKLGEVCQIFESADISAPQDLDVAPIHFLKAIEKAHRHKESWESKMKFQRQVIPYFSDLPKYISSPSKGSSEPVSVMYRMVGYIVKYCSKLIYVQQDLIIPSIIGTMVVPHSVMNPDKPINPSLLAVLKDTLHMYIQGLSKLAYDRDPYVQRRLKDIVQVYLPKFSLQSPTTSLTISSVMLVHPVVASLSGSFIQHPLPDTVKFRHHVMSLVSSHFLMVKNFTVHPGHGVGWTFLYAILQRTSSPQVKASDLPFVLGPSLEYLLLMHEHSTMVPCILSIFQTTAEAYKQQNMDSTQSDVTSVLQKFITTYFKFNIGNVIKVMEKVAVLLPACVVKVIDLLSRSVFEIENKRGVGQDQHMRNKYYSLLRVLGEVGQAEIARLKGPS